jgi:hypothetical protein
MGYYITLEDSTLVIPADRLDEAYAALCALNNHNTIKGGCRGDWRNNTHDNGPDERVWFSWMEWNYPEVHSSTEEILTALGFDVGINNDGSLCLYGYDNKIGDEAHFLDALAPFAISGTDEEPQVVWRGEDGAVWRQVVIDGRMVSQAGRLVFDPA